MASETDPVVKHRPVPDQRPIEAIIGRNIAKRAVFVAPVLIVGFGLFRGWEGAIAAAVGVAIVAGNFVLGGYIMSTAARISLSLYHAAALFGFIIRLGLITASMLLIAAVTDIDRLAMGISVVVSYLVLLSWEAVAVTRGAERDIEWSN
jgi:hypothetical protein